MKNSSLIIYPNQTIKVAFKLLNVSGKKCLFVVDKKKKILGTLTDGDIRKAILKNKSINEQIFNIYNTKYKFINSSQYTRTKALKILLKHKLDLLPVINSNKKIINIAELNSLIKEKDKNKYFKTRKNLNISAVIMAGGFGTRLKPFTNILPKPLIPVNDKPIIKHIVDGFQQQGVKNIIISINHKAEIIKAYFHEMKLNKKFKFLEEKIPLGTCGSLKLLSNKLKKDFIVTNCDTILNVDLNNLKKFHLKNKNQITIVVSAKEFVVPYGVCNLNKEGFLSFMEEKPRYNHLINTGLYILHPSILKLIPKNKKFNFNKLLQKAIVLKKNIGIYPVDDKAWIDVGQWPEYKKAITKFKV